MMNGCIKKRKKIWPVKDVKDKLKMCPSSPPKRGEIPDVASVEHAQISSSYFVNPCW